jgi:hypothetical protein
MTYERDDFIRDRSIEETRSDLFRSMISAAAICLDRNRIQFHDAAGS